MLFKYIFVFDTKTYTLKIQNTQNTTRILQQIQENTKNAQ